MKKHLQKKYKPGELAKTRSNLGDISEEEARKMAEVLGGEVGVEQELGEVRRKNNKQLQIEERQKRLVQTGSLREEIVKRRSRIWVRDSESAETKTLERKHTGKEKIGYLDRIRIDYLSSRPEHRLKNVIGVIASFFSFLPDASDYINPLFIKNADELFFFSLGSFVRSVRGLYSKARPDVYKEIAKSAFYTNILATLKMWDIEGINMELSMLQRNPYRADVGKASGLIKKLYRPFGVLLYLDHDIQVKRAIRWAYEMNIAMTPPENRPAWKNIMKNFETAIELLPIVFSDIKRMLYPLILKLTSKRFLFFEEYFVYERKSIFRFLTIMSENIINPQDEKTGHIKGESAWKNKDDEEDEVDALEGESGDERNGENGRREEKARGVTKRDFEKGIALLDTLFPGAGFTDLRTYPDLYPYFQPLFEFPQGFELIPTSDPLQQVVVICTIVNNILYAFRHIRFGTLRRAGFEPGKNKEEIELLLAQWPMFLEEIVFKTYIVRLADYCRNIEKDSSFIRSELGEKAVRELYTIKKSYLLPYMKSERVIRGSVPVKKNYAGFYEVVKETREVLLGIAGEIEKITVQEEKNPHRNNGYIAQEVDCESVKNPLENYVFDIENPVSRRLDWIAMKGKRSLGKGMKKCDTRTNADIISTCLILVSTLDFLLNSGNSHFYSNARSSLFRTSENSAKAPEYSVRLKDTQGILKEYEKERERERECEPSLPEVLTGEVNVEDSFIKDDDLTSRFRREIEEYRIRPVPFSFIFICITGNDEPGITVRRKAEEAIKKEIRSDKDVFMRLGKSEFLILLARTDLTLVKSIGMKMIGRLVPLYELKARGFAASCGVLQYRKDWDIDMLSNVIEKIKRIVRKQASPRLVFLDDDGLTLKGIPI